LTKHSQKIIINFKIKRNFKNSTTKFLNGHDAAHLIRSSSQSVLHYCQLC
jgi:hypothetical protein